MFQELHCIATLMIPLLAFARRIAVRNNPRAPNLTLLLRVFQEQRLIPWREVSRELSHWQGLWWLGYCTIEQSIAARIVSNMTELGSKECCIMV